MPDPTTIEVLPRDMLQVCLQRTAQSEKETLTAIACRYLPADIDGKRGIILDVLLPPAGTVISDGNEPSKIQLSALERLLLTPDLIHTISPLRP